MHFASLYTCTRVVAHEQRETDRQTETDRETERDTQTDTQTDRERSI